MVAAELVQELDGTSASDAEDVFEAGAIQNRNRERFELVFNSAIS